MSRLNIELFKKIRDRIAEIPESYDQNDWHKKSSKAPCGTTACLAGHAIICNAPTVDEGLTELRKLSRRRDKNRAIPDRAAALLGLVGSWSKYCEDTDARAAAETIIFSPYAQSWPEPYRTQFLRDEQAAAVAYLDHIIETGKVLE